MTAQASKVISVGNHEFASLMYEVVPDVKSPIVADGDLKLSCGAYLIQNVGNCPVVLSDGWTIMPGGNLSLGVTNDHTIIKKCFRVVFLEECKVDNKCYQGPRLEIMELCAVPCLCPVTTN